MSTSIHELAWVRKINKWVNNSLPGGVLKQGTALPGFRLGTDPRVHYIDADNRVNELAWAGGWVNTVLPGNTARAGSGLTSFEIGTASRVYYIDTENRINELS